MALPAGAAWMSFDGERLHRGRDGPGLRFTVDARCLEGEPVPGAVAWVSAAREEAEGIPYDQAEVQGARQDVMGWWVPLLGNALVCHTTLALDASRCAGAITVLAGPVSARLRDDPFARLFGPVAVACDVMARVPPPAGPVLERYAGAPWPGGRFG